MLGKRTIRNSLALLPRIILGSALLFALSGCIVVSVADAAVTVVATGVKVTAKGVGAVADAVTPSSDKAKKD